MLLTDEQGLLLTQPIDTFCQAKPVQENDCRGALASKTAKVWRTPSSNPGFHPATESGTTLPGLYAR